MAGALHGAESSPAAVPRRPNVVVIVTDDQRYDALGVVQREQGAAACYPFFQSPALDRLAAGGARFRNAFVVHSLCSPSRATMLTGLPTHVHGIRDNRTPFHLPHSWAVQLAGAGYKTGYFGKWHMGTQAERPGFAEVFSYNGQGVYMDCVFQANGVETKTQGWIDDVTTDHAIAYIKQNARQPFALFVGFKAPHNRREPAARHAKLYADVDIKEPVSFRANPPFRPATPNAKWNPRLEDRLHYFRCLNGVDDNVGRLLDTLEQAGLADDTMVIFAGDNGYYLGEHNISDKRTAYEESIRIPLLIRYPRRIKPGTLVDALSLNLDFAATILDAAGMEPDWPQFGRSLFALTGGQPPADWRTSFYYENYVDPEYPTWTYDLAAVRTQDAKLVTYSGHPEWTQLFDLRADPYELSNLANAPESAPLRKKLVDEQMTLMSGPSRAQGSHRD